MIIYPFSQFNTPSNELNHCAHDLPTPADDIIIDVAEPLYIDCGQWTDYGVSTTLFPDLQPD